MLMVSLPVCGSNMESSFLSLINVLCRAQEFVESTKDRVLFGYYNCDLQRNGSLTTYGHPLTDGLER